jgi:hypothetical protein
VELYTGDPASQFGPGITGHFKVLYLGVRIRCSDGRVCCGVVAMCSVMSLPPRYRSYLFLFALALAGTWGGQSRGAAHG